MTDKSFSEIFDRHLTNGTRPVVKGKQISKQWSNVEFANALGVDTHERTVRNWRAGRSVPDSVGEIESVLFGNELDRQEEREILRAAHLASRNRSGPAPAPLRRKRRKTTGNDQSSPIPDNLPFGSIGSLFKGRDDFLGDIETALAGGAAAITGKGVVHGLGGVGKTRAAVEYALRHRDKYSALLFVPAKSPDDLHNNFAALCAPAVLNLPEQEAPQQDIRTAAVRRWLAANTGWFLLFDNADTKEAAEAVEALIANLHGGDILVTSRVSEWSAQVSTLPLDVLAAADAIALLLEATPRRRKADDDEEQAALLAEKLGFLSLAVTQAAAYINQRRMTIATYLEEWDKNHTGLLGWFDAQTMQYPQAVAATWETTFGQMSVPAQALLNVLAFYSHEPIPESILDALPEEAKGKLDLHAALAELERFSFVSRDDDAPEFSVHRLVQQVARDRLDEDGKVGPLTMALGLLQFVTSGTNPQDVRDWPELDPLQPHALAACAAAPDNAQDLAAGLGHVLNEFGTLFYARAQHGQAEPLYRRALAIDEKSYGPDHPAVARDLNNLAGLLRATNRLGEAEPLYRRALAIAEKSYGPDHPTVAIRLNNLAGLLEATNRLGEAEPLYRRSLEIAEKSYGPDHPTVAIRLNNLAGLLGATNRLGQAEPLSRRHLLIFLKFTAATGHTHPHLAPAISNHSGILQQLEKSEAETLAAITNLFTEAGLDPAEWWPKISGDGNKEPN